jgi:hypothetical protein
MENKQQIINEFIKVLLSEAPEDIDNVLVPDHTPSMHGGLICRGCGGQEDCDCETFNECNQLWKSLLTKHLI